MELIKEQNILGGKKIVIGDKQYPLVLNNSGSVYVQYGGSYLKLQDFIKKFISIPEYVITEKEGIKDSTNYSLGQIIFDTTSNTPYMMSETGLLPISTTQDNDLKNQEYISDLEKRINKLEQDIEVLKRKI